MLIQILFSVPSPSLAAPALEVRMIADDQITDIAADPATGRAVVLRKSAGIPGLTTRLDTWETTSTIFARIAGAQIGAAGVLVSASDLATAQTAHQAAEDSHVIEVLG